MTTVLKKSEIRNEMWRPLPDTENIVQKPKQNVDVVGPHLSNFGVTIWLTEFCQHFEIQIITPADTLSYFFYFWAF